MSDMAYWKVVESAKVRKSRKKYSSDVQGIEVVPETASQLRGS